MKFQFAKWVYFVKAKIHVFLGMCGHANFSLAFIANAPTVTTPHLSYLPFSPSPGLPSILLPTTTPFHLPYCTLLTNLPATHLLAFHMATLIDSLMEQPVLLQWRTNLTWRF